MVVGPLQRGARRRVGGEAAQTAQLGYLCFGGLPGFLVRSLDCRLPVHGVRPIEPYEAWKPD